MDLTHDHEIWRIKYIFIGTVNKDDPLDSGKHQWCDNKVDEVVDGVWYKKTVQEYEKRANGECSLVLGSICYCDKQEEM